MKKAEMTGNMGGVGILGLVCLSLVMCGKISSAEVVQRGTVGYFRAEQTDKTLTMLKEINANAVAVNPGGRSIEVKPETVRAIQEAGLKVWAWTMSRQFVFWNENKDGLKYPYCFAGPYRQDFGNILSDLAGMGFDGIFVSPDEFMWNSGHIGYTFGMYWMDACQPFLKEQQSKWKFPYSEDFKKNYMARYKAPIVQDEGDPNFRYFMTARYQAVADAHKYWVDRVKKVKPDIQTTTLFASYICTKKRYHSGAAWDIIGQAGVDSLGTDPYVQLHNYRGDANHWYPTETAIHLTSANQGRPCTIVPEGSRLRDHLPEKRPVDIYGPGLSSVVHGARNLFYFSTELQLGAGGTVKDLARSHQKIKTCFDLLAATDALWANARTPRQVAVVYSRASDDLYQIFLRQNPPNPLLAHRNREHRYAFLAQKEVIHTLLKEGYPFQMFYLDQLEKADLTGFPVIVLPFPFSVPKDKAAILEYAVTRGSTLVVISEVGQVDEIGTPYEKPALLDLLGLLSVPGPEKDMKLGFLPESPILSNQDFSQAEFSAYESLKTKKDVQFWTGGPDNTPCGIVSRPCGKGEVIFLGGEFGLRTAVHPDIFAFAGEFSNQQDIQVTDIPWERIGVFEKKTSCIETELPLSPSIKNYKMTIVVTGAPDAGPNDRFDVKINGEIVWSIPITNDWDNINKMISVQPADVYRVRIDLVGAAGAKVHKMFFNPVISKEEKSQPLGLKAGRCRTIFLTLLNHLLGEERLLTLEKQNYHDDIETWLLEAGKEQWLLFMTNWDDEPRPIKIGARVPAGAYEVQKHLAAPEGYRAEKAVKMSSKELQNLKLKLGGQQASVWLLKKQ